MTPLGDIPPEQRIRATARLPGIAPVGQADWITVDACYSAQIALKQDVIAAEGSAVHCVLPAAEAAAAELLTEVITLLDARTDFDVSAGAVRCPDGRIVTLEAAAPLLVLSEILQEDLCLHLRQGNRHFLMGALLCFPASWTLAEKIGKPLGDIHGPVPEYDAGLGRRVQRLFDGVQVGRPIWRANCLTYDNPALYQPRREADPRHAALPIARYERSERQTLFRLPRTRAVVFAIHTVVARIMDQPQQDLPNALSRQ